MHAASCAWAGYNRAMNHDHSYKLLFAHPRMVRDLLEAFVTGEWINDADFSTLERGNGNYIADDLRERADDIIWRVRCGENVVYLLIEFQSGVDRFMAVRVLTYVGLLYQDLIRETNGRDLDELPAILPIVLHSGRKPWSAAEDVSALVSDVPRELEPYRPGLRYLLIDQPCYDDAELASRRNFAAMLFRIEGCRQRELMRQLVGTLREWLQDSELDNLGRAFAVWLGKVVFKRLSDERACITNELWEKPAMLSETVDQWEKELREEGWQKGRQEGRQEGAHELMVLLLRKRFGELPEPIRERLRNASLEQLERWTECLLDAKSLGEVFGCVRPMAPAKN
jgi:predicted transposase YdaD